MNHIIIVGSGYSGSSAIRDYLISRKDCIAPFYNQEFRFINDPDGIDSLYLNLYKNFSLNNAAESLNRFRIFAQNTSKIKFNDGKKLSFLYSQHFMKVIEKYLEKIIKVQYSANPQFKVITESKYQSFLKKLYKKIFKEDLNNQFKMGIGCGEKDFLNFTKKLIRDLILLNIKKKKEKILPNIILDQAVNFFQPETAFRYYDNLKIIIVTRDPRSIYYSMKSRNSKKYPWKNIETFTEWYKIIMNLKQKPKKNINILNIKFENFAKNFSKETIRINKFLNIKNLKNYSFDDEATNYNAFKAKKLLTTNEKKYIEKKLKKYLQW